MEVKSTLKMFTESLVKSKGDPSIAQDGIVGIKEGMEVLVNSKRGTIVTVAFDGGMVECEVEFDDGTRSLVNASNVNILPRGVLINEKNDGGSEKSSSETDDSAQTDTLSREKRSVICPVCLGNSLQQRLKGKRRFDDTSSSSSVKKRANSGSKNKRRISFAEPIVQFQDDQPKCLDSRDENKSMDDLDLHLSQHKAGAGNQSSRSSSSARKRRRLEVQDTPENQVTWDV